MSRAAFATFSARPTSVWISTYAVTLIGNPLLPGLGAYARRASVSSGQASFQGVELLDQLARHAVAELREVLADAGQLPLPRLVVDRERRGDVVAADVEAFERQIVRPRDHA